MLKPYRDIYEDILSDHRLVQGLAQNDPKALAEWNRRMEKGRKIEPECAELIERAVRGEGSIRRNRVLGKEAPKIDQVEN